MNFLIQLFNDSKETWKQLSSSARVNLGLAGLAVMLVMGVVIFQGAKPQYVTLRDDLDAKETAKIKDVLVDAGIDFKVGRGNKSVTVPLSDKDEARMLLDVAGIVVSSKPKGWDETFTGSSMMDTDWTNNVKLTRAKKGQLEQMLMSFDFVEWAIVDITKAEQSLFADMQEDSAANVVLSTTAPLSDRQIKGFVSMISRAGAPYLHKRNITMALDDGTFLHDPYDDEYTYLANDRFQFQTEHEKNLKKRVELMLKELGMEGAVTLSAQMDFDELTEEAVELSKGQEISIYEIAKTYSSEERAPEGPPGMGTNIPEGMVEAGGMIHSEETTEPIANLDVPKTVTKRHSEGGKVVQYNVAVTVSGSFKEVPDPEDEEKIILEYDKVAPEKIETLENMVLAAVGHGTIPTEVSVSEWPLDVPPEGFGPKPVPTAFQSLWMTDVIWNALQILAIILGFFLVRRFLLGVIEVPEEIEEEEELVPISEATREDVRRERVEEQVISLTEQQPELVAQLLRTWLSEDED